MPRISLPGRVVQDSGSTGVQPDIYTDAPQMAAISRLAGSVEGLADQKFESAVRLQRHVDSGALAAVNGENKAFVRELDNSMLQTKGHKSQRQLAAQQFKQRRESVIEQFNEGGISGAAKRQALEEIDTLERSYGIGLARRQINESIELANYGKQSQAKELYRSGDNEEANAMLDSLEGKSEVEILKIKEDTIENASSEQREVYTSEAQMAETVEQMEDVEAAMKQDPAILDKDMRMLRAFVDRRKKGLMRESDFIAEKEFLTELLDVNTSEAVEAMPIPQAGDKARASMKLAKEKKRRSLKFDEIKAKKETFDSIRNGTANFRDIDALDIPEDGTGLTKERLRVLLDRSIQGSDVGSEDFEDANSRIDKRLVDSWAGDFDSDDVEAIYAAIDLEGGKFNNNAARLLVDKAIRYEMAGWQDGEISGTWWRDIPVSESMATVAKTISSRMSSDLAAGQRPNAARIGPEDALEIINSVRPIIEDRASDDVDPDTFYKTNIEPIYNEVLDRSTWNALYSFE